MAGADATPDQLDELFRRQVQAVVFATPWSNVANAASIIVLSLFVVPEEHRPFGLAWMLAALSAAIASMVFWFPRSRRPVPDVSVCRRYERILVCEALVHSTLDGIFAIHMFPRISSDSQVVLAATLGGIIGAGAVAVSPLRTFAITWIVAHVLWFAPAFWLMDRPAYDILIVQLVVYGAVLIGAVLYFADSFDRRSHAEFAAQRAREVVELLLDDFEGGAREWLWETDASGSFTRIPERLAEVSRQSAGALRQLTLVEHLETVLDRARDGGDELQALVDSLHREETFRDRVVPVSIDGAPRWWSLSGKPIRSATDQVTGWRGVGADVTDERTYRDEMSTLAKTDPLTALANRRQFQQVLQLRLTADGRPFGLAVLDLDNFKAVNDSLGHTVGDELLASVARRLTLAAGDDDFVARMGGDEFAIISSRSDQASSDPNRFATYLHAFDDPFDVRDNRIDITASIGSVDFAGGTPVEAEELLVMADLALYDAKARGRQRVSAFDPSMRDRARRRVALLSDLRRAIERQEFVYYHQPQVDLRTGQVVAREALLRWVHPVRGLLAPAEFLTTAEDSGLIIPLGEMMLREACLDCLSWHDSARVAVNVSHAQLNTSGYREAVTRVLEECAIDPARVEFEVTETGQVSDAAIATLNELRRAGSRIAVDDFGTGYSSLATLQRMPVDLIKVDRTFVAALDRKDGAVREPTALLGSVVNVGAALGIQTLAEGVERADQLEVVRDIGFDLVQGFHLQVPEPAPRPRLRLVTPPDSEEPQDAVQ